MKKAEKNIRKKGGKGGVNNNGGNMELQTSDENMKNCCKVCFDQYNGTRQRPRVLPCGHSYCSLCIGVYLLRNKIVCPSCRKEHCANDPTDFPINYELENNLSSTDPSLTVKTQMTTALSEEPGGISNFLCSPREELFINMKNIESEVQKRKLKLQGYESQMNSWKEKHLNQMELHLSFVQKHYERFTCISKENQSMRDASGLADTMLQEIRTSANDLNASKTNYELLLSLEQSNSVYCSVQECMQKYFAELIIRTQNLIEESHSLLKKENSTEWKVSPGHYQSHQGIAASSAEEIPACGGKKDLEVKINNIQEKIKCLLANLKSLQQQSSTNKINCNIQSQETLSLTVSDLRALTPIARSLIESNLVFAAQGRGKKTRFARISLDGDWDICVHTLCKHDTIPKNAIRLQHQHVMGIDVRPGLAVTFLDLAAEGQPLGRLRISLVPYGNLPLNFFQLCTGEKGPSYVHSSVFNVEKLGRENWLVELGDYETNDGEGGRAVDSNVNWEEEWKKGGNIYGFKKWKAGSVAARGHHYETASQFGIYTRDKIYCKDRVMPMLRGCFGMVDKDGLNVLKESISDYRDGNLEDIVIVDCGVILPRP